MTKPFLSVLITTFNRKDLLQKAVLSVQNQGFEDLEIIISDDNSNDGTSKICEKLCKKDARIVYVKNKNYKKGPNGNKNNALDFARGEFVMFLDDDDELLQGAIKTLVEKSKDYEHIFGNCYIQRGEKLSKEFSGKGFTQSTQVSKKDFLLGRFYGEFLSIFKKSLLENKRFNDELYGNEAVLWVNLYEGRSFYIHKALRIYKINREDSVTSNAFANAKRVYLGYLELAKLLESQFIASKDKDYKKPAAYHYKMAAYYAKFAKMYKKMLWCLFKSLSIKPTKEALMLLCVCFVPRQILKFLTTLRVKLCKN